MGSGSCIQPGFHVGPGLVLNRICPPKGAAQDCRRLESPFQNDGPFAILHKLTTVHYQAPARGPDAGITFAGVVPAREMARREQQRTGSLVSDLFPRQFSAPKAT